MIAFLANVCLTAILAISAVGRRPIFPFLPNAIIRSDTLELVMIAPGYTTLIDTPVCFSSSLSPNEKEDIKAFDAGYTVLYAIGLNAAILDIFII